jgi:hypothetical protein
MNLLPLLFCLALAAIGYGLGGWVGLGLFLLVAVLLVAST